MAAAKKWKQSILKARELRGNSMGILFERVKLLVGVFEDEQFREDENLEDDFAADKYLSKEVDEFRTTGSTFLTLRAVYQRFQAKAEWETSTLPELLATMQEEHEAARDKEAPNKPRKTATFKDLQEATDRADFAEKTIKHLEQKVQQAEGEKVKSVRELEARITALEAENDQLREDNARLRGRIEELERVLNRELVAA